MLKFDLLNITFAILSASQSQVLGRYALYLKALGLNIISDFLRRKPVHDNRAFFPRHWHLYKMVCNSISEVKGAALL